ncbi:MAG: efflux RND transporter periplasmic adaptor subunit [Chlamydiae bacterium]|nr:efflux RND transporter periplasmic adaptor subunit [Chlamydiota bacterium]
MKNKYILPIIALLGAFFGLFMVYYASKKPPIPKIEFPPPIPPYTNFVAGYAEVQAYDDNVEIGTPFNEIITDLYVQSGDIVKKGDPLFKLDIRTFQAALEQAQKEEELAISNFEYQKAVFSYYERLKDKKAVSEKDYTQSYYDLQEAKNKVDIAKAKIDVAQSFIDRSFIKAPFDGQVLEVNIHLGEIAIVNPFTTNPLIVFGRIDYFEAIAMVDEEEAWRIQDKAPATAYVRGNSSIKVPLEFVKIRPLIVPKTSLTGDNQEKVDTRVMQIEYRFKRGSLPIYSGEILDVYIEGKPYGEICEAKN